MLIIALSVRREFRHYVNSEKQALAVATAIASRTAETYAQEHDQVLINAINTTGGTLHIFVGTVGAIQDVGDGIQTPAAPQEVTTLAPHRQTWLIVKNWQHKFITSTTTYVFLGTVAGSSSKLVDLDFYKAAGVQNTFTVYYASPSSSDSNFIPQYGVSAAADARELNSLDVIREQMDDLNRFSRRIFPRAEAYPTSFWSYIKARNPFA